MVRVVRGEDLVVADEGLDIDWTVSESGGVALLPPDGANPAFSGDQALPVRIDNASGLGWRLTLTAPVPLATDEYRALRFALLIDPDQFAGVRRPLSVVLQPGSTVDLVAEGLLDPTIRDWQVVEIPLQAFELEGEPIASIRFLGRLEGGFLVDDLRLVSHFQGPGETAVHQEHGGAPAQFALGQSYPNPFNGQVVIPFALAQAGEVELVVYDLLGQRVAVLVEGLRTAGPQEVRWDAGGRAGLASGVYFYRLQTANGVKVGKMILLQ